MKGTQLVKLHTRGGIAAIAIATAALLAAGCGGSDSGATGAAKDSAALDYVPKDAIAYVTIDTDFSGKQWTQLSKMATAVDPDFKSVEDQIIESAADSDDKVDFQEDVDPWLGESGGAAILSMGKDGSGDDAEVFAWFEVDDRKALEAFAKDQKLTEGDAEVNGFQVWNMKDDDGVLAVKDDLAILTEDKAQLAKIVKFDGESIKDAAGVSDAIDGVEADSLGTVVVSGAGIRKAIAESSSSYKDAAESAKQLKDFQALALSMSAGDDGFLLDGNFVSKSELNADNVEHPVFQDLPGNTVLAIGGHDLGGVVKTAADQAGKGNAQVQQAVGAASAVLGVDIDDLAKALEGEFVLGMSADDEGLGALAGGVAGAAMGGGLGGVDPGQVLQAGTVFLAFGEEGDAAVTLDKVAGAIGGLTGATAAPTEGTAGDFKTKQLSIQGLPVTTAASDDVAALSLGLDVFTDWGSETLSDNDAFKAAWKAADAPDESTSVMWLDAGRIATLAGVKGSDDAELGGMVGWSEGDDKEYHFSAFVHVDMK
jgi:hypothetical protein